jgi:hypothetical protein
MTTKQWMALACALASIIVIYLLITLNFPKLSVADLMTLCIISVIGCPILFWYVFVRQLNPWKKLSEEHKQAPAVEAINKAFDAALPALNIVFLVVIVTLIYFVYIA